MIEFFIKKGLECFLIFSSCVYAEVPSLSDIEHIRITILDEFRNKEASTENCRATLVDVDQQILDHARKDVHRSWRPNSTQVRKIQNGESINFEEGVQSEIDQKTNQIWSTVLNGYTEYLQKSIGEEILSLDISKDKSRKLKLLFQYGMSRTPSLVIYRSLHPTPEDQDHPIGWTLNGEESDQNIALLQTIISPRTCEEYQKRGLNYVLQCKEDQKSAIQRLGYNNLLLFCLKNLKLKFFKKILKMRSELGASLLEQPREPRIGFTSVDIPVLSQSIAHLKDYHQGHLELNPFKYKELIESIKMLILEVRTETLMRSVSDPIGHVSKSEWDDFTLGAVLKVSELEKEYYEYENKQLDMTVLGTWSYLLVTNPKRLDDRNWFDQVLRNMNKGQGEKELLKVIEPNSGMNILHKIIFPDHSGSRNKLKYTRNFKFNRRMYACIFSRAREIDILQGVNRLLSYSKSETKDREKEEHLVYTVLTQPARISLPGPSGDRLVLAGVTPLALAALMGHFEVLDYMIELLESQMQFSPKDHTIDGENLLEITQDGFYSFYQVSSCPIEERQKDLSRNLMVSVSKDAFNRVSKKIRTDLDFISKSENIQMKQLSDLLKKNIRKEVEKNCHDQGEKMIAGFRLLQQPYEALGGMLYKMKIRFIAPDKYKRPPLEVFRKLGILSSSFDYLFEEMIFSNRVREEIHPKRQDLENTDKILKKTLRSISASRDFSRIVWMEFRKFLQDNHDRFDFSDELEEEQFTFKNIFESDTVEYLR